MILAHFRQKWTHGAGRRRTPKISRPAGQDFGPADMGWGGLGGGGGPAKFWLGRGFGEGKSEDSLWRRDLSALGPFGAEANFSPKINLCNSAQITKEVQPKPSLTFWFALIWSIFEGFATKDQPQGPRCLPTGQLVHMAPQKDARLKAGKGRSPESHGFG